MERKALDPFLAAGIAWGPAANHYRSPKREKKKKGKRKKDKKEEQACCHKLARAKAVPFR